MTALAALPSHVLAAALPWESAWDRVRAKHGMPGVDGLTVSAFAPLVPAALRTLCDELACGQYRPLPLRLVELPKKDGTTRALLVPAIRDRIAQTAAAMWLAPRWNCVFDQASFAYRPGLGVHNALRRLRTLYEGGYRWVLDADIKACFDNIPHGDLLSSLADSLGTDSPMVAWLRSWIRVVAWDGRDLIELTTGIPQGSSVSPLLANFFLDAFDRRMRQEGIEFIRYADDFLVLARTPFELLAAEATVRDALGALRLTLNARKSRLTSFGAGFRFLGAEIVKEQILVPFEKKKLPGGPVHIAPPMPRALLAGWRTGHIHATPGTLTLRGASQPAARVARSWVDQTAADRLGAGTFSSRRALESRS